MYITYEEKLIIILIFTDVLSLFLLIIIKLINYNIELPKCFFYIKPEKLKLKIYAIDLNQVL